MQWVVGVPRFLAVRKGSARKGLDLTEEGLEDPNTDLVAIWPVDEPKIETRYGIGCRLSVTVQSFRLDWRGVQYSLRMDPRGIFLGSPGVEEIYRTSRLRRVWRVQCFPG